MQDLIFQMVVGEVIDFGSHVLVILVKDDMVWKISRAYAKTTSKIWLAIICLPGPFGTAMFKSTVIHGGIPLR